MRATWSRIAVACLVLAVAAGMTAWSQEVSFEDPTGDDDGPGAYVYPTDAVYEAGSFDLTGFSVQAKGKKVDFDVDLAAKLDDPWRMGTGFSVQMVFVFIDTDGKEGSGFTDVPGGLNVQFDPKNAWDKLVVLSPQTSGRVRSEVDSKVASTDMKAAIVVPTRVQGRGNTISASVKLDELGGGDPSTWSYQVLVQSNEGFPKGKDLLTRKVNEFEGQHRFGGGTDFDCDPHVMDLLAASVDEQHGWLSAYECDDEGNTKKLAVIGMVKK